MNIAKGYSKPKDYVVSISDEINKESFLELIAAYNKLEDGDYLYIYIHSIGGDVAYSEAIIDLINENCDRTFLVAHGNIYSAAFEIFYKAKCERKVLPGTTGASHFCRVPVTMVNDGVLLDEHSRFTSKWAGQDVKRSIGFYIDLGFSKSEINLLKQNKDVFFNEGRLKVFLKNSIKLINAGYQ